ncbi:hypothetical protein llap_13492 [Limosa lapponica baueri]|uniref:Uncharacterized protein n=1 Tax=Limosa lapponica baueri TaxID=1758121 RepID=A0A2I0TQX4_LIMLA|nr:hypothetical protein llap_13492 [Limosa lapponica baueri]
MHEVWSGQDTNSVADYQLHILTVFPSNCNCGLVVAQESDPFTTWCLSALAVKFGLGKLFWGNEFIAVEFLRQNKGLYYESTLFSRTKALSQSSFLLQETVAYELNLVWRFWERFSTESGCYVRARHMEWRYTLQHLNVFLVVMGPKLDIVFEVEPHQCRAQGDNHCPSPAGYTIPDTGQDAVGLLGHLDTLLAHVQLAVDQHPQVLLHQAVFQPLFPSL